MVNMGIKIFSIYQTHSDILRNIYNKLYEQPNPIEPSPVNSKTNSFQFTQLETKTNTDEFAVFSTVKHFFPRLIYFQCTPDI